MAVTGIGEPMIQYGKASESIYNHKPKHSKKHGIKMPDTRNIIAVFAGIFVVVVIITQLFR
jgi:hypothetical protein